MTTTHSTIEKKSGQAAVEAALGLFVFAFVVAAFVAFAEVFIHGFEMMGYARRDAGEAALAAGAGTDGSNDGAYTFAAAMHPERDALDVTCIASRPWRTAADHFPGDGKIAQFENDAPRVLDLVAGEKTEDFHVELDFGGNALFPDDFQLSEKTFLPPLGGL